MGAISSIRSPTPFRAQVADESGVLRVVRTASAAAFIAAALAWGIHGISESRTKVHWQRLEASGPGAILSAPNPPVSTAFLARARARSENQFPPDRTGAVADLQEAIAEIPFKSGYWFLLARQLVFLGNREAGRAALSRSDELDPFFPPQRLRSAQLWALLGEEDRAAALARSAAALGDRYRREALQRLLEMGFAPGSAFEMVEGQALSTKELTELLPILETADAPGLGAVLASLDDSHFADRDYSKAFLARCSKPFLFESVVRVWEHDSNSALEGTGLVYTNDDLSRAPFAGTLPLGWLAVPARAKFTGTWAAPGILAAVSDGGLRLTFPDKIGEKESGFSYPLYRLPVRAGVGFRVSMAVKPSLAEGTRAWLEAVTAEGKQRGDILELSGGEDAFQLELNVPPQGRDGFVLLTLGAVHQRKSKLDTPELYVDGIAFREAPE